MTRDWKQNINNVQCLSMISKELNNSFELMKVDDDVNDFETATEKEFNRNMENENSTL